MRCRNLWILVSAGFLVDLFAGFLTHVTSAAPCKTVFHYNATTKSYGNCSEMTTNLNVVTIAWSYEALNRTLDVAFSSELETYSSWLGWGINRNCAIMPETDALVAYRAFNGSTILPYKLQKNLLKDDPPPLKSSPLDVEVLYSAVEFVNVTATMFITVRLQPNQTYFTQVWSQGFYVSNDYIPSPCTASTRNVATLDVNSGVSNIGRRRRCPDPNLKLKNIHGLLNGISWGFLYPLSQILGYFSLVGSKIGYLHYPVLYLSYILGTVGFSSGPVLHKRHVFNDGDDDRGHLNYHRNMSIAIITFASLQILLSIARLLERLRSRNHNSTWTTWYLVMGAVVSYVNGILIIINILKGIDLLKPEKGWKTAYIVIAIISALIINTGGESFN